jgi:hypothetical protein
LENPVILAGGMEKGLLLHSYGKEYIRALVRDPECIFGYWEVSEKEPLQGKLFLKISDLEKAQHRFIPIDKPIGNWYITVNPGGSYVLEIRILQEEGRFKTIAISNKVTTPRRYPVKSIYRGGTR